MPMQLFWEITLPVLCIGPSFSEILILPALHLSIDNYTTDEVLKSSWNGVSALRNFLPNPNSFLKRISAHKLQSTCNTAIGQGLCLWTHRHCTSNLRPLDPSCRN